MFVRFGVLHFLGLSAILYHFIRMAEPKLERIRRACRIPDGLFPVVTFLLYVWTYATVHQSIYNVDGLAWVGFRNASYCSSDYFPMVPFFFLYLFGIWMGKRSWQENSRPGFTESISGEWMRLAAKAFGST